MANPGEDDGKYADQARTKHFLARTVERLFQVVCDLRFKLRINQHQEDDELRKKTVEQGKKEQVELEEEQVLEKEKQKKQSSTQDAGDKEQVCLEQKERESSQTGQKVVKEKVDPKPNTENKDTETQKDSEEPKSQEEENSGLDEENEQEKMETEEADGHDHQTQHTNKAHTWRFPVEILATIVVACAFATVVYQTDDAEERAFDIVKAERALLEETARAIKQETEHTRMIQEMVAWEREELLKKWLNAGFALLLMILFLLGLALVKCFSDLLAPKKNEAVDAPPL